MQNDAKIKIGFVITKGVWGGAQKYVYTLAVSLPKDRYDVFVVCGEGSVLKQKLQEKGVCVYELSDMKRDISFVREYKSSLALLKIIRAEKPDVLHLNSPKAAGFGAVAGRLTGVKKIIQTVHGFTFNEERGKLATIIITFFSWLTLLLCHTNIVIAEREKRQALAMPFVFPKKITLLPLGISKIAFVDKSVAQETLARLATKEIPTDTDTLWLGTVAELHKNKSLDDAINAVSKIQTPFVYFIVGEGEERKNLEKLIAEKHLENKVFLVGFLENANQYLKAFDIFMLVSRKEGLPYTLIEAGSASLPCIATNVGGIPDIIENGNSGILVKKGGVGEITRALEYLIGHEDTRTLYGKNLEAKVDKDFSIEQMMEKIELLYSN